jgi:acid phosphatase class B
MAEKDPWDREDFWEVLLDGFDQMAIPEQIAFMAESIARGKAALFNAFLMAGKIQDAINAGILNTDEQKQFEDAALDFLKTRDMVNKFFPENGTKKG